MKCSFWWSDKRRWFDSCKKVETDDEWLPSLLSEIFAAMCSQGHKREHWRGSLWEVSSDQCQNGCSALSGHLQQGGSCGHEGPGRGFWPAEAPGWEAWRHSAGWLRWLPPGIEQPKYFEYSAQPRESLNQRWLTAFPFFPFLLPAT